MMKGNTVFALLDPRIRALETNSVNVASTYVGKPQLDIWGGASPASHQLPNSSLDIFTVYSGSTVNTTTYVMPQSPFDMQRISFATKAAMTTLIFSPANAGSDIIGPIATLGVNGATSFRWVNAYSLWIRNS